MSKPRPWWETHPRKYWSAEDRRAARKAGVLPPPPQPDVHAAIRPLVPSQPHASLPGGLYGGDDRARHDTERHRKVNALLEKHGLRQGTW
jgi:hypothetical protein